MQNRAPTQNRRRKVKDTKARLNQAVLGQQGWRSIAGHGINGNSGNSEQLTKTEAKKPFVEFMESLNLNAFDVHREADYGRNDCYPYLPASTAALDQ